MSETDSAERRRYQRTAVQGPVDLHVPGHTLKYQNAVMVSLSEQGARIRGDISLAPQQSIDLVPKDIVMESIPSRVVWVTKTDERVGEAGLQFLKSTQLVHALRA